MPEPDLEPGQDIGEQDELFTSLVVERCPLRGSVDHGIGRVPRHIDGAEEQVWIEPVSENDATTQVETVTPPLLGLFQSCCSFPGVHVATQRAEHGISHSIDRRPVEHVRAPRYRDRFAGR